MSSRPQPCMKMNAWLPALAALMPVVGNLLVLNTGSQS